MNIALSYAKCLSCGHSLNDAGISGESIICNTCGSHYPLLNNEIPVLFSDPGKVLATIAAGMDSHIARQRELMASYTSGGEREKRIIAAIHHNTKLLEEVKRPALPYFDNDTALTAGRTTSQVGYANLFHYVRRDWCYEEVSEAEFTTLLTYVSSRVKATTGPGGRVLLLGAGAGRLAWELAGLDREVVAIDNSLTLASCFYRLTHGPLEFYDVRLKNALAPDKQISRLKASLNRDAGDGGKTADDRLKNISYILCNALEAPFADSTFDAVVSVYFTDVFPLRRLLPEVKKLLKDEGSFIHFGPLDYHFNQPADMLSASEVLDYFNENGFRVSDHEFIRSTHLCVQDSMHYLTYNNLAFTATGSNATINAGGCLHVAAGVTYTKKASLQASDNETIVLQQENGTRHEIGEAVLEVLKRIDGTQTPEELAALGASMFEAGKEAEEALLASFRMLTGAGFLTLRP